MVKKDPMLSTTDIQELKHYMGILAEDFGAKISLVTEAMQIMRDELIQRMDGHYQEHKADIADLKAAVRRNSEDIRELQIIVRQHSEDIRQLQGDVRILKEDFRAMRATLH